MGEDICSVQEDNAIIKLYKEWTYNLGEIIIMTYFLKCSKILFFIKKKATSITKDNP